MLNISFVKKSPFLCTIISKKNCTFDKKIMIPIHLIKSTITPVMTSFSGNQVLAAMDESRVTHLPIVNNQDFLGVISEADLFNNSMDNSIGTYKLSLSNAFVLINSHIYDAVKLVCELKLSIIPVIDDNNVYHGYLEPMGLVEHFGNQLSINNPGGIIELELSNQNFSLIEIAQIAEDNEGKILHLGLTTFPDSTKVLLTIKFDKIDISSIIQAFTRYGYTIAGSYGEDEMKDYLKDRYDSLMNYLNV